MTTPIRFEHGDGHIVARARSPHAWAPLALVADALAKTAHAYAHGHEHPVEDSAHWLALAPGAVATMAHPERHFLDFDDTCTPERAALFAHRVRTATRSARITVSAEDRDRPFAFVATPGVPDADAPTLSALAVLALEAASDLAGPISTRTMRVACATLRDDDEARGGACPGLIATRLDRPDWLEIETCHALCAVAGALIDDHPGICDWLPRHRDPTVRLRNPVGAPGLPLVFVPVMVETEAARRALADVGLIEGTLAQCAPPPFAPTPVH